MFNVLQKFTENSTDHTSITYNLLRHRTITNLSTRNPTRQLQKLISQDSMMEIQIGMIQNIAHDLNFLKLYRRASYSTQQLSYLAFFNLRNFRNPSQLRVTRVENDQNQKARYLAHKKCQIFFNFSKMYSIPKTIVCIMQNFQLTHKT